MTRDPAIPEAAQKALGKRLREAREFLNLSQQFVADQTGIPRSAMSDIERGVRKVDSLELQRFSDLYRFPVGYFLGEAGEEAGSTPENLRALNRTARDLTTKDRQELLKFALFLQHFRKAEPGGERKK
jgi:transcriptional regulator with XRE-family HTH domain